MRPETEIECHSFTFGAPALLYFNSLVSRVVSLKTIKVAPDFDTFDFVTPPPPSTIHCQPVFYSLNW